jgi:glycosyltransferase involved in cell wall biosynthesis
LRRENFDIVHSYLRIPGVLARVAALGLRTRVIISERNVDLGHHWRDMILERPLVRKTPAVIANAEAVRLHVERRLPELRERVHVIPNGIDWSPPTPDVLHAAEAFRAAHLRNARLLLGVVGRIEPQKAPHVLLDALSALPEDILDQLQIVWVGIGVDTALTDAVTERIRSAPLAGRVSLLPPTRQIRSVYHAIDALVLPSRWEGFPNVLLEAMTDARPAVATDVGDVRAMIEPGVSGWIVPPGDAPALGRAIEALVRTEHDRLVEMGEAGSVHVRKEFSVSNLVGRTMDVYRLVLPS